MIKWHGRRRRGRCEVSALAESAVVVDEAQQSFDVLVKVLDIIVSSTVDPQRLDSVGAALIDGSAVAEVNHLVVLAVNH